MRVMRVMRIMRIMQATSDGWRALPRVRDMARRAHESGDRSALRPMPARY